MYYVRTADRLERTAAWLEGREGGLEAAARGGHATTARAQPTTSRPTWPATSTTTRRVDGHPRGPQAARRFVSFVNAPDETDPSITFVERSGRKVPMGMPKFRPLQETT